MNSFHFKREWKYYASCPLSTILFTILTCAQRTRVNFCPQHWLLCHLGLYQFEFEDLFGSAKWKGRVSGYMGPPLPKTRMLMKQHITIKSINSEKQACMPATYSVLWLLKSRFSRTNIDGINYCSGVGNTSSCSPEEFCSSPLLYGWKLYSIPEKHSLIRLENTPQLQRNINKQQKSCVLVNPPEQV